MSEVIETLVTSYGAGTNSTAKLIEMFNRGTRPDLILFADTGAERPETYDYVEVFSLWLRERDFPEITVVKNAITLEDDCLKRKALPSLAYGFKTCSQRWKAEQQDKYLNNWQRAREVWKSGEKIIKTVGYDAGEWHRAKDYEDKKYKLWYPLIEWEIDREQCTKIICKAGLPQPGKSSCFFCPSMKKHEILELRDNHPDLLRRALDIESNAELTSIDGLGRSFAWKDLIEADENQIAMFKDWGVPEITCGCYD